MGSNWRVGAALRKPVPVCLLTTIGRKSGQRRTVPLCYLALPADGRTEGVGGAAGSDSDRIVLVASQGGLPTNPQWFGNLQANPEVEIEIAGRRTPMLAHTADPAERAELWPQLVELYADYENYATWTDREIPVVVCRAKTAS